MLILLRTKWRQEELWNVVRFETAILEFDIHEVIIGNYQILKIKFMAPTFPAHTLCWIDKSPVHPFSETFFVDAEYP